MHFQDLLVAELRVAGVGINSLNGEILNVQPVDSSRQEVGV